jgi:hypothetical protein
MQAFKFNGTARYFRHQRELCRRILLPVRQENRRLMRQLLLQWIAIALLLAIVGGVLSASPWPQPVPYLAFGVTAILVGVTISYVRWKRADQYSLTALKELHEAGGPVDPDDVPEVDSDASILCMCCGTVRPAELLACPECGRSC